MLLHITLEPTFCIQPVTARFLGRVEALPPSSVGIPNPFPASESGPPAY